MECINSGMMLKASSMAEVDMTHDETESSDPNRACFAELAKMSAEVTEQDYFTCMKNSQDVNETHFINCLRL